MGHIAPQIIFPNPNTTSDLFCVCIARNMCLKIPSLLEIFVSPIALVPHVSYHHTINVHNGRYSRPISIKQFSLVSISHISPCKNIFQILMSFDIISVLLGVIASHITQQVCQSLLFHQALLCQYSYVLSSIQHYSVFQAYP